MITIRNLTKRPITLILDHRHACSHSHCLCGRKKVGVNDHDRKTGERTVRAINKRVPISVDIMAKGSHNGAEDPLDVVVGIHDNVAQLPQVKKLLAEGSIEVKTYTEEAGDGSDDASEDSTDASDAASAPSNEATTPAAPAASTSSGI